MIEKIKTALQDYWDRWDVKKQIDRTLASIDETAIHDGELHAIKGENVYELKMKFDRGRVYKIDRYLNGVFVGSIPLGINWQAGDSLTVYNITRINRVFEGDDGAAVLIEKTDSPAPKGFAVW